MNQNISGFKVIILLTGFMPAFAAITNCGSKAVGTTETSNMNNKFANNSLSPVESPNKTPTTNSNKPETTPIDWSNVLTVTYCELVKDSTVYDKKVVRLRAIYLNEFERSYVYDSRCEKGESPEAPKSLAAETWAEWDKSFVSTGDTDEAKLNREIKGFGRKDVTVIGRFYSTGEDGDPNAPNRFGHMNCCRFQFRIIRVEKVINLDKKVEKSAYDYGKPVKYVFQQKLVFADFTLEYLRDPNIMLAKPVFPSELVREMKFRLSEKTD